MTDSALQELLDRQKIADTIYRYASTNDFKDYAALRDTFVDDAVAQYHTAPPIEGADAIVKWIEEMCVDKSWQHHLLNVYHIDIDGDEARTLVYHTSHQTTYDEPDKVLVIVARYTHVLRRVGSSWKIADLRMTVGWMEEREFPQEAMNEKEAQQNSAARAAAAAERV
jgi:ketosteroid isomerase-like protein